MRSRNDDDTFIDLGKLGSKIRAAAPKRTVPAPNGGTMRAAFENVRVKAGTTLSPMHLKVLGRLARGS